MEIPFAKREVSVSLITSATQASIVLAMWIGQPFILIILAALTLLGGAGSTMVETT
jgi:hypothetical protein